MYCRNCGELLLEDDKFCSKCGKKVIRKSSENGVDEKDNKECENEEIKRKPVGKIDINWNLSGFPDKEPTKSEDMEFSWDILQEKREIPVKSEPLDSPFININEGFAKEQCLDQGDIVEEENAIDTSSSLEDDLFDEMNSVEKQEDSTNVDKFFTYNKKIEEYQVQIDEEYDKLNVEMPREKTAPIINGEIKSEKKDIAEPLQFSEANKLKEDKSIEPLIDFNIESKVDEKEIEDFKLHVSESDLPYEPKTFEEVLLGTGEPNVDRPTLKFAPKIKETIVELADDSNLAYDVEETTLDKEQNISQEEMTNSVKKKNPPSSESIESKKATFDTVFNSDNDEDIDEYKENNKILKVVLWILVIVLVLEIGIIGVKKFFPDTTIAKNIVSFEQKYFSSFFAKEEAAETEDEPVSSTLVTDLIGSSQVDNKNIGEILENVDLKAEIDKSYAFKEIAFAKPLVDTEWYKEGEKSITYGGSIVDVVIGYYSNWVGNKNGEENKLVDFIMPNTKIYENALYPLRETGVKYGINHLEIGQILQGENSFYVFTKVGYIDSKDNKEIYKNKIIRMEALENAMKISDIESF